MDKHWQLTKIEGYQAILDVRTTETAIRKIKEFFQANLAEELNLIRATAPLFVKSGTGINDDLNGIEKPVSFNIKGDGGQKAEIVQSLAKWKRMALKDYGLKDGEGIYTDMNAIRPDEVLDNLHSIYVDQWDWEKVIKKEDRTLSFLKATVESIYEVIKKTERFVAVYYPQITPILPEKITFIHSEDLEEEYPLLTPVERESKACLKYGAIFVIGIGNVLKSGEPHDGRSADYDDWTTTSDGKHFGLNGDILVYNPILKRTFELSSMGIRVDKEALEKQLKIRKCEERKELLFHKLLLNDQLPLSIGGGLGQSRLCMFFLRKAHVGEVQVSLWPDEMKSECFKNGMPLL